jgi:hypothetical protein
VQTKSANIRDECVRVNAEIPSAVFVGAAATLAHLSWAFRTTTDLDIAVEVVSDVDDGRLLQLKYWKDPISDEWYTPRGTKIDIYTGTLNGFSVTEIASQSVIVQLAAIRVKLGNTTISVPNDTQASPSPAPFVMEFDRFLQNNETWEFPFVWRILNTTTTDGSVHILSLQINNQTVLLSEPWSRNGHNFRFIFELWVWDTDAANFQFGWFTANERRVAWLQIWFNATSIR